MRTARDVEAYLLRLNRPFELAAGSEQGGAGTYLLSSSAGMPPVALRVDPPLIVIRVHIGDLTAGDDPALLRRLLELNARGLVHASYGLDGAKILLSSALELENLDFNELEAMLDEVDLALAEHVPALAELSKKAS